MIKKINIKKQLIYFFTLTVILCSLVTFAVINVSAGAGIVTITFDGNGAEGLMTEEKIVKGENYTLPANELLKFL